MDRQVSQGERHMAHLPVMALADMALAGISGPGVHITTTRPFLVRLFS